MLWFSGCWKTYVGETGVHSGWGTQTTLVLCDTMNVRIQLTGKLQLPKLEKRRGYLKFFKKKCKVGRVFEVGAIPDVNNRICCCKGCIVLGNLLPHGLLAISLPCTTGFEMVCRTQCYDHNVYSVLTRNVMTFLRWNLRHNSTSEKTGINFESMAFK